MKILIQNKDGNAFLRNADVWTRDPNHARPFPDAISAMAYCARHHLHDVTVVLKFSSARYDVALQPRWFPWTQADWVRDSANFSRHAEHGSAG